MPNQLLTGLHASRTARRSRYVGSRRDVEARVCYSTLAGREGKEPLDDFRTVLVRDGRDASHTLDGSGFELAAGILDPEAELGAALLRAHRDISAVAALHEHVKGEVYRTVAERLHRRLRATRVIPFDHVLRHGGADRQGQQQSRPLWAMQGGNGPISRVHNDYSLASGFTRARMHLTDHVSSAASLERALAQRFAIVNVWAPLPSATVAGASPVRSDPLGMIEWDSIAPRDVQRLQITCDCTRFATRETYSRVAHNPRHRWTYFADMSAGESLLLKTFDSSSEPAVSKFALHGSFALPGQHALPLSALRQSIEIRCLVFFGKEAAEDGFGAGFVPPPGQAGVPGGPSVLRREWLPRRVDEWEVAPPALPCAREGGQRQLARAGARQCRALLIVATLVVALVALAGFGGSSCSSLIFSGPGSPREDAVGNMRHACQSFEWW